MFVTRSIRVTRNCQPWLVASAAISSYLSCPFRLRTSLLLLTQPTFYPLSLNRVCSVCSKVIGFAIREKKYTTSGRSFALAIHFYGKKKKKNERSISINRG